MIEVSTGGAEPQAEKGANVAKEILNPGPLLREDLEVRRMVCWAIYPG